MIKFYYSWLNLKKKDWIPIDLCYTQNHINTVLKYLLYDPKIDDHFIAATANGNARDLKYIVSVAYTSIYDSIVATRINS